MRRAHSARTSVLRSRRSAFARTAESPHQHRGPGDQRAEAGKDGHLEMMRDQQQQRGQRQHAQRHPADRMDGPNRRLTAERNGRHAGRRGKIADLNHDHGDIVGPPTQVRQINQRLRCLARRQGAQDSA